MKKIFKRESKVKFFALPNCFLSHLINVIDDRVIRFFDLVRIFNFQEPIDFQLEKKNDDFIIIQDDVGNKLRQKCGIDTKLCFLHSY